MCLNRQNYLHYYFLYKLRLEVKISNYSTIPCTNLYMT